MSNKIPDEIQPTPQVQTTLTQQTVEYICEQGCSIVRECIEELTQKPENQKSDCHKMLAELNPSQQQEVLKELKSIMDVYDNKDCN